MPEEGKGTPGQARSTEEVPKEVEPILNKPPRTWTDAEEEAVVRYFDAKEKELRQESAQHGANKNGEQRKGNSTDASARKP
jgi:hypothetical protein